VALANGVVLAVIDGLGHGREAAVAARVAADTLEQHAGETLEEALKLCHAAMRRTRGAVISIASFDTTNAMLSWTGVGNVDGTLFRTSPAATPAREALLLRGGVVGFTLPPVKTARLPLFPGDTLVLATDGISSGFKNESICDLPVQEVADTLLDQYGKATDDALVLVARYVGAP
jgi:serine/threonine protein phosphatase PrpC